MPRRFAVVQPQHTCGEHWECSMTCTMRAECMACVASTVNPANATTLFAAGSDYIFENERMDDMPRIRMPWARCFGIEIETTHGQWADQRDFARDIASTLSRTGPRVTVQGDEGGVYILSNGWGVGYDGSCGWEVKSPLLSGENGLADLERMLKAMRDCGASVSSACGIHVHVDTRDIRTDHRKVGNLAAMIARSEDLIFAVTNRSRATNSFCRNFNAEILRGITRAESLEEAMLHWYGYARRLPNGDMSHDNAAEYLRYVYDDRRQHGHGSRYNGANMHSIFYRGSIEMRYFNSTVSRPDLVSAWIVFCVALVEYAARAERVHFPSRAVARYGDEKMPQRFARLLRAFKNGKVLADFPECAADVLARRMSARLSREVSNPLRVAVEA